MTADLAAYLRACLDEDERIARAAAEEWTSDPDGPAWMGTGLEITPHVLRHDPARVLREVEAKRKILELHASPSHRCPVFDQYPGGAVFVDRAPNLSPRARCDTIRALAAPYSDHPDFNPAWLEG